MPPSMRGAEGDEAIQNLCSRWIALLSPSSGRAYARTRWLAMTLQAQPWSSGMAARRILTLAIAIRRATIAPE
ncbi:hypothetical protein [Bradyrhizobium sp. STM 3557]|uniref:hypothetical protein n=1 Tax=Bradyrhizobium sp. STM 3557 TaxID=578920 RepID=UPI00388F97CA